MGFVSCGALLPGALLDARRIAPAVWVWHGVVLDDLFTVGRIAFPPEEQTQTMTSAPSIAGCVGIVRCDFEAPQRNSREGCMERR